MDPYDILSSDIGVDDDVTEAFVGRRNLDHKSTVPIDDSDLAKEYGLEDKDSSRVPGLLPPGPSRKPAPVNESPEKGKELDIEETPTLKSALAAGRWAAKEWGIQNFKFFLDQDQKMKELERYRKEEVGEPGSEGYEEKAANLERMTNITYENQGAIENILKKATSDASAGVAGLVETGVLLFGEALRPLGFDPKEFVDTSLSGFYEASEFYAEQLKDATIFEKVAGAFLGAGPGIFQFLSDVGSGGTLPFVRGSLRAKNDGAGFVGMIKAGGKEAAEALLLKKLFVAMHKLNTVKQGVATGAVFAGQAYMHGERDPEMLAESFALGPAFAMSGVPSRMKAMEAARRVFQDPANMDPSDYKIMMDHFRQFNDLDKLGDPIKIKLPSEEAGRTPSLFESVSRKVKDFELEDREGSLRMPFGEWYRTNRWKYPDTWTEEKRSAINEARVGIGKGDIKYGSEEYNKLLEEHGSSLMLHHVKHTGRFPVGKKLLYGAVKKGELQKGEVVAREVTRDTPYGKKTDTFYTDAEGNEIIDAPIFPKDPARRKKRIDEILQEKESKELAKWYEDWDEFMRGFEGKDLPPEQIDKHIMIQAVMSASKGPQGNQKVYASVVDLMEKGYEPKPGPQQLNSDGEIAVKWNSKTGNGEFYPGVSKHDIPKITRIWEGKDRPETMDEMIDMYGPKVGRYMHAGLYPRTTGGVVIDRHMPRLWGFNVTWNPGKGARMVVDPHVERLVTNDIVEAARRNNMTVPGVQAALWFKSRLPDVEAASYREAAQLGKDYIPGSMYMQTLVPEMDAITYRANVYDYIKGVGLEESHNIYSNKDVGNRKAGSTDAWPYVPRGYFYSPGVRPEPSVKARNPVAHLVKTGTQVYDYTKDRLGFVKKADKVIAAAQKAGTEVPYRSNVIDNLIKEYGYDGYAYSTATGMWFNMFGEVPVKETPITAKLRLSDVTEATEKLPQDFPTLKVIGRERYTPLVEELIRGVKSKYQELTVESAPMTMARFGGATSGSMEYGVSFNVTGPVHSAKAFASEFVGLSKAQNMVFVETNEPGKNSVPGKVIRFQLKKQGLDKMQEEIDRLGVENFNIEEDSQGRQWVDHFVMDSKSAAKEVQALNDMYEAMGKGKMDVYDRFSEALGDVDADPVKANENYKKHIIDHWGVVEGENVYTQAVVKGEGHKANGSGRQSAPAILGEARQERESGRATDLIEDQSLREPKKTEGFDYEVEEDMAKRLSDWLKRPEDDQRGMVDFGVIGDSTKAMYEIITMAPGEADRILKTEWKEQPEWRKTASGKDVPFAKVNLNLSRLNTSKDIDQLELEVGAAFKEQFDKMAPKTTVEEITRRGEKALADDLGISVNTMLNTHGGFQYPWEVHAMRTIVRSSAEKVLELGLLANDAKAGPIEKAAYQKAMALHAALRGRLSEKSRIAGQVLRAHSIIAAAEKDNVVKQLDAIISLGGGPEMVDTSIKMVADLANNSGGKIDLGKLNKALDKMHHATTTDMLYEVYINSILSGITTQAVNVAGNTLTMLMAGFENYLSVGVSRLPIVGSGELRTREANQAAVGFVEGIKDGFRLAAHTLRTGESYDAQTKIDTTRRSPAITAKNVKYNVERLPGVNDAKFLDEGTLIARGVDLLGEFVRLPGRGLNAGDAFFKSVAYRMAIRQYIARKAAALGDLEKIREWESRVLEDPANFVPDIHMQAMDRADYQTFTNDLIRGGLGSHIEGARKAAVIGPMVKVVIPFVRTPVNIFRYGALERSPLGLVALLSEKSQLRQQIAKGGAERDTAIARMALGSAISGVMASLALDGTITGGGPTNPEMKKVMMADGWMPYSVRIGGKYYAYDRFDPLGVIMGLAADSAEILAHVDDMEATDITTAVLLSMSNNVFNKTYMRGVADLLDSLKPSTGPHKLPKYLNRLITSTTPYSSIQRAVTRAVDPRVTEAQNLIDHYKQAVGWAGSSKDLIPMRDWLGDVVTPRPGLGNEVFGPVSDLVMPFRYNKAKPHPVNKETIRLMKEGDLRFQAGVGRSIMGINLRPNELDYYREHAGKLVKKNLIKLYDSAEYKSSNVLKQSTMADRTINTSRMEARENTMQKFERLQVMDRIRGELKEQIMTGKGGGGGSANIGVAAQ